MAVPAGTTQTFQMVGIREQLSDVIINIAPMDTPFFSGIKKGSAKTRTPEWQRDTLANPSPTNKAVEGTDATNLTAVDPDRLKNITQLFEKTVQVSSTAQAVLAAGRSDELKYQVAKRGKELKRDIEMRITGNWASVLGNASTAGEIGGYEAWMVTNTSRGAAGASGGFSGGIVAAATDGTPRTFTETLLKTVIQKCWNNGANVTQVHLCGDHKQQASAFTGIATQYRQNEGTKDATILGAAGIYVSDFGVHKLMGNRFIGSSATRTQDASTGLYLGASSSSRSVLVVDPTKWKVDFLQPFRTTPLAKTGHADRRMLFAELTLECAEERSSGIVADLS
jgi:hypothetical protein